MKKIILIPAIAGLLFVAGANAQLNLVTNGDFELNDLTVPNTSLQIVPGNPGDSRVDNWSITNDSNAGFIVDQGGNSFITTFGVTWISDIFNVTAGLDYTRSMQIALQDPDNSDFAAVMDFYWLDSSENQVGTEFFVVSNTAIEAQTNGGFSFDDIFSAPDITAPATASKARIELRIEEGSGGSLYFDNVSVVPEPSTYAMIAGFLAFGFVAVRRRMATK